MSGPCPFLPYGLVTDWKLYTVDDNIGQTDTHLTFRLWYWLLDAQLYKRGERYISHLSDQDAPEKGIDLYVESFDANGVFATVFAVKCAHTTEKREEVLEALHKHQEAFVKDYFNKPERRGQTRRVLYSAIAVGSLIRISLCCRLNGDIYIEPFWGGRGSTDLQFFRNVGTANGARDIADVFEDIKESD